MLTHEENELITRIGPGTPMGNTLRRYWIPALLASELPEPDGPPVRVKPPGRGPAWPSATRMGAVGLLDELCPHRRASLFFGRNEECGLRCVYHGWKFDVDGRCVDMMNEPEELRFKQKIRQPVLSHGRARRPRLDLHGPARAAAAAAEVRLDPGAGDAPARVEGDRGVQLAPGARRRHRHLARADPAPAHHDQLQARRGIKPDERVRARQGAEARRRPHGLGLSVRRPPAARTRPTCTSAPITS